MNIRTLALTTTSLVVLGMAALPASAGMMGDVRMGYGHSWTDLDISDGGESDTDIHIDNEYPSILGRGRVNLPYSSTVNIQLDAVGRASLDDAFFSGKSSEVVTDTTHFALGGHINYRDDQGLLGIFGGVGRMSEILGAPVFLAGFEGQYFCEQWTLSAQVGYMDADASLLLRNAGFARAGATYYSSKKLKFTGELAYIDGDLSADYFSSTFEADVEQWAWSVGAHYWFGNSIPVSGFIEYRGRTVDGTAIDTDPEITGDVDEHTVNAGVTFHFGGDGFLDADRNGASVDLPDLDWYRVVTPIGSPSV